MNYFITHIRQFVIALTVVCSVCPLSAQSTDNEFQMPVLPEEFESESARANYMVTHFWDRIKLDNAIKNTEGFKNAFANYIMYTPFADADVTHASIDNLIKAFDKNPDGLLALAQIAEEALYSPDGMFRSDEFYLPFASAIAKAKKISQPDKARYIRQSKILSDCQVGHHVPELKFTKADGTKAKLSDYTDKYLILFVNDPDCDDCTLARVRLTVDSAINKFINAGKLNLVSIYPDEPDDEWRTAVSSYNPRWIVGATSEIDDIFDLRSTPTIYYINPEGIILSKSITVEQLLEGFSRIAQ